MFVSICTYQDRVLWAAFVQIQTRYVNPYPGLYWIQHYQHHHQIQDTKSKSRPPTLCTLHSVRVSCFRSSHSNMAVNTVFCFYRGQEKKPGIFCCCKIKNMVWYQQSIMFRFNPVCTLYSKQCTSAPFCCAQWLAREMLNYLFTLLILLIFCFLFGNILAKMCLSHQ